MIKKQSGFTLIELIVVIITLGILSVVVAPKFIDITSDAKAAVVKSLVGTVKSTSNMIYAKSMIQGDTKSHYNVGRFVTVQGVDIPTHYGYIGAQSLQLAIEIPTEFTLGGNGSSIRTFSYNNIATCRVTYTDPGASVTTPATVTNDVSGC